MTPFLGSKKVLLGQSGCVRHPRLFIMVGVYSPTLYNNWGVEWESLFSQPLFHGMPEGFEHCSSGYIGKICSGALRWFTGLHMPCFMQPEDVRKIVDGLLKTYWECHLKSQLTHIFPRGRLKPPTSYDCLGAVCSSLGWCRSSAAHATHAVCSLRMMNAILPATFTFGGKPRLGSPEWALSRILQDATKMIWQCLICSRNGLLKLFSACGIHGKSWEYCTVVIHCGNMFGVFAAHQQWHSTWIYSRWVIILV